MAHCAIFQRTREGLLLAAVCCYALASSALCAQQPVPLADTSSPDWQYPEQDNEWVSPMPDDMAPPGRILSDLPQHPLRHMGFGQPLQGTSWLNRPYYVGAFGGTWMGESLLSDEVDQGTGFFGGYWLGSDLNHYWGSELRLSLFYVNTLFTDGSRGTQSRNLVGDVNLLYYPWGDSRWRPYGSIGLGVAGFHFTDRNDRAVDHTGLQLPIGFGVKYLCRNWLAVRLDIKDNIVFGGNNVSTTSNWSFLGGVELHWGGKSSARYYPW